MAQGALDQLSLINGDVVDALGMTDALGTKFSDETSDTAGGLVIAHLGRLPKRGETTTIDGVRFQVLRADSRRVYTLLVDKPK